MIDTVLLLLNDQLNEYLRAQSDWRPEDPGDERVTLLEGEQLDPIRFKLGAITTLLINLEEENTLRRPDLYRETLPDGRTLAVQPAIRLNLYVLFVAHFKVYQQGLRFLSLILRFFQNHRVIDRQTLPGLGPGIERLVVELVTLPFSEQNEVWNALRTTYHPSVLYKVGVIVLRDAEGEPIPEARDRESRWAT